MSTDITDRDLTALLHAQIPFARELGLRAIAADPAEVRAIGDWRPDGCTSSDSLHGGYLMAIADTIGATCAAFNLPPGTATKTIRASCGRRGPQPTRLRTRGRLRTQTPLTRAFA